MNDLYRWLEWGMNPVMIASYTCPKCHLKQVCFGEISCEKCDKPSKQSIPLKQGVGDVNEQN